MSSITVRVSWDDGGEETHPEIMRDYILNALDWAESVEVVGDERAEQAEDALDAVRCALPRDLQPDAEHTEAECVKELWAEVERRRAWSDEAVRACQQRECSKRDRLLADERAAREQAEAEVERLRADAGFWRGMVEECHEDFDGDTPTMETGYMPAGWWSRVNAAMRAKEDPEGGWPARERLEMEDKA